MASTTATTLEHYLATTYSPDVEYINGKLKERNVGSYEHWIIDPETTMGHAWTAPYICHRRHPYRAGDAHHLAPAHPLRVA